MPCCFEPRLNPKELKAKLTAEGFLVFRTLSSEVQLAERVRENLILDSGVAALLAGESFGVRLTVRSAQTVAADAGEAAHYQAARDRAVAVIAEGFVEVARASTPVLDPGDPTRTLDTWHEVAFQKDDLTWPELLAALRWALAQSRR